MENDGGIDDLFGALSGDEADKPRRGAEQSDAAVEPADPSDAQTAAPMAAADASAALNAAFIEAATAPFEAAPAFDATVPTAASEDVATSAPVDHSTSAFAPPLTRRELRERQRAADEGDEMTIVAGGSAAYYARSGDDSGSYIDEADESTVALYSGREISGEPASDATAADIPTPIPTVAAAPEGTAATESAQPPTEPFVPAFPIEGPGDTIATPEPPVEADRVAPEASNPIADSALAALAATSVPAPEPVPSFATAAGPTGMQPAGADAGPVPRQQVGRGFPIHLEPPAGGGGRKRRSVRWLAWFLPVVIVLGGAGFGAYWVWTNYEEKVREVFGWEIPNDFTGNGNGEEAIVTILPGYIGDDVAIALHEAGVTKTFDAFHDLLIDLGEQGNEPSFQPGNYRLQHEMSAQAALDALMDPANKLVSQVIIPEGSNLPDTLAILSEQTGIPLEELQAQAADPAQFGVGAASLEGYLYPAQYDLDGTETAQTLLQRLVTTMFEHLDALGVAPELRNEFLTKASIVQKESGPIPGDMAKIARVFENRIAQGMKLESDATVTYGTCVWGPTVGRAPPDTCGTVWLNQVDIDDTTNPYNTRANPGLPVGPIAMPGQAALEAVAAPADGPWLFFVAVNLATGETVFSETLEEHDAAVEQLYAWCEATDENASYCA